MAIQQSPLDTDNTSKQTLVPELPKTVTSPNIKAQSFIESNELFRPEKILNSIREVRSTQRGKIMRAYEGVEVHWNLEIAEVYRGGIFYSDQWNVEFTSPALFPTRHVEAMVAKSKFPDLMTLKKGTKVHVSGTVYGVGPMGTDDTVKIDCQSIEPY